MNIQKKNLSWLPYIAMIVFFLTDWATYSFFEKPKIFTTLGFLVLHTLPCMSGLLFTANIILIILLNFFYQGRFLLALVYLVPTIFLSLKARCYLDDHPSIRYVLTAFSITFFCFLTKGYISNPDEHLSYTFIPVPVTLIIMLIFSLI